MIAICLLIVFSLEAITRALTQNKLNHELSNAVAIDDVGQAAKLLKQGADPNAHSSGYTFPDKVQDFFHPHERDSDCMLWIARGHGNKAMYDLLVTHGADRTRDTDSVLSDYQ